MQRQLNAATDSEDERGTTLLEMVFALSIVILVLTGALVWLSSANRVVATTSDRAGDNAAAQSAIDQLDVDLRYASDVAIEGCGSGCSDRNPVGTELYVLNGASNCAAWYATGGNLVEQTSSTAMSVVAAGISSLSFATNSSYNGLISVSFTLNQTDGQADPNGVTIDESFAASNMSTAVGTTSHCSFTS